MLKELSIEGYPYALITYREERECQLKQYKKVCQQHGFNEVMKRAYLNWARKDPLIPGMYFRAMLWVYFTGLSPSSTEWVSYKGGENYPHDPLEHIPEAITILQQGAEAGCGGCVSSLFHYYLAVVKPGDTSKQPLAEFYKAQAKRLMLESGGG